MFSKRSLPALLAAFAGLVASASPVMAHDGSPHNAASLWNTWSLEPGVLLCIGLAAVLYMRGWRVLAGRGQPPHNRLRAQAWAFAAGMTILLVGLVSPVDALAEEMFWVHMLQHNLLMLAAAPLLVLSNPAAALILGLPSPVQRGVGYVLRRASWLHSLWQVLSSLLAAWMIQAVLLWAWHTPVFYQAAIETPGLHALQHFTFLGSALLFWWVNLQIYGAKRANRGLAVASLFTTALHSGLLGALLTFSTRLWYPVYSGRAEAYGISALADQQLAGTIMWVPAGLVYLAAALWLMKSWLDEMETRGLRKADES